ncbi:ABC transporter permease [Thermomonas sp.]|uniref:ABC transporter permease n=1 Tax=Thermomonas sp. TaxID=1971895 RepID=UPI003D0D59CA
MNPFTHMRPVVSALRGHRASVLLLVLEIALTLAVLCNLMFIITGTFQRTAQPTGITEMDVGLIQSIGVIGADNPGTAGSSLAALQSVPGVEAAAFGVVPLWGVPRMPVFLSADAKQPQARPYQFVGSQGLNRVLGVQVLEGRDILEEEIPTPQQIFGESGGGAAAAPPAQMPALLTQSLASHLFPGESALGKTLHTDVFGNAVALRVVGVIAPLRAAITGHADDDQAVLIQFKLSSEGLGGGYLIRSKPGQLQQVLPLAAKAMQQANPGHVQQEVKSVAELRTDYFRSERATARMLLAIVAILLAITALGVTGLASFWVQQRTKQIGIRRALGATRRDILRYFQLENFLIVGAGVLLGTLLAFALNQWLMRRFELDHLDSPMVITGAIAVWLLGQLAVLGPALRAAAVPPIVATRSA